jgi:2-polyprenyl-6-methoxyphenol hydroxylase-like FAD-dependent oxidoreductase
MISWPRRSALHDGAIAMLARLRCWRDCAACFYGYEQPTELDLLEEALGTAQDNLGQTQSGPYCALRQRTERTPVSTGSPDDLQAELARLRAENERLKAGRASGRERITVSPKGGVSVYGLGRFPITLYQEQWLRLLAMGDAIHQFIVEHKSELKLKDPSGE